MEKFQLPCYMPYESRTKNVVEMSFKSVDLCKTGDIQPNPTSQCSRRKNSTHLLDPRRIELFKRHRQFLSSRQILTYDRSFLYLTHTNLPHTLQTKPKKLTHLKPITLKEMDPTKNHLYDGCVLSLTIIEETLVFEPSILLLVEDDNLDIQRLFIYGFHPNDGLHLIKEVFRIGKKMDVLNPSIKIGTTDLKPGIRVDDFQSIIMQDDTEQAMQMCRCCGEGNAMYRCSKCKTAFYCSKECQFIDWKHYRHKWICKKQGPAESPES